MKYDIESIQRRKNIHNRIKKIIFIFLILIIYNIVLIYASYASRENTVSFFSYKAYVISTTSMEPELNKGDVTIVKKVAEKDLKVGDIITFKIHNNIITHRILSIEDGVYTTKGDNNNIEDSEKITYADIEGRQILKIPYLGNFVGLMKNGIIIILTILIFLIFYLNKIQSKQKSEVRREKKKIADEEFKSSK